MSKSPILDMYLVVFVHSHNLKTYTYEGLRYETSHSDHELGSTKV